MKIKNLLMGASVLFSTALTPLASQAAVALFPQSTDQDLVNFGSNSLFHDVYRFEVNRAASCTAVKVDLELGYPVYLTDAHCLKGVKSIDVQGINGDLQPTHFLVHPNYEKNPLDDLAAFWNPQQKGHLGYALYQEALSASPPETFLHAGFGTMRSGKMPRQAFFTCPMRFEEAVNLFSADCRKNTETTQVRGKVTNGDSGGGLFVQEENGNIQVAGLGQSSYSGKGAAHGKAYWRRIDEDFIQTLKDVALTTQNAISQEGGLQDNTALAHVEISPLLNSHPSVLLTLGEQKKKEGKYEEAISLYRQAGAKGRLCELFLTQAYDLKAGRKEEVKAICEAAAHEGDADAQFLLGILYEGSGSLDSIFASLGDLGNMKQREADASYWIQKAIDNGSLRAVSHRLKNARGEEEVKLNEMLAQHGNSDAQYDLAKLYMTDEMVTLVNGEYCGYYCTSFNPSERQDVAKALRWLKIAIEASHPKAEYAMAKLMINGFKEVTPEGTITSAAENDRIPYEMLRLLEQAADKGEKKALIELGEMYFLGKGVPQDKARAAAYWVRAVPSYVLQDATKEEEAIAIRVIDMVNTGQWLPQGAARNKLQEIADFSKDSLERNTDSCDSDDYCKERRPYWQAAVIAGLALAGKTQEEASCKQGENCK